MAQDDLWGNLPQVEQMETPLSILRAQARLLKTKTNGRVVTGKDFQDDIEHDLRIVAPALGNYSTTVLSVIHDALLYPASVAANTSGSWGNIGKAIDGPGLKELIGRGLQSPIVHKTIAALLAQSRDAVKPDREAAEPDDEDNIPF